MARPGLDFKYSISNIQEQELDHFKLPEEFVARYDPKQAPSALFNYIEHGLFDLTSGSISTMAGINE